MPNRLAVERLTAALEVVAPGRPRSYEQVRRAYEGHYSDVYRYLLTLTRSRSEAEDVAAETFERALRSWDPPPVDPLPWLLLTARRITTDRWRRARRFARLAVNGELRTSAVTQDPGEFWLWFEAVSQVLTARQREVLALRYQRDLTDADIADVMGISASGVRSLVSRALETLRANPELL